MRSLCVGRMNKRTTYSMLRTVACNKSQRIVVTKAADVAMWRTYFPTGKHNANLLTWCICNYCAHRVVRTNGAVKGSEVEPILSPLDYFPMHLNTIFALSATCPNFNVKLWTANSAPFEEL